MRRLSPPSDPILTGATLIAAKSMNTCAVTGDGVVCWGYDHDGEVGNGTTSETSLPFTTIESVATSLAVGGLHSCAVVGGGFSCWGYNTNYQLGDGTTTERNAPVAALLSPGNTPLAGVTAVSAGYSFTCASVAGSVNCWGQNAKGQLGVGNLDCCATNPTSTPVVTGATAITSGYDHTCVIVAGHLKCWGDNSLGQLGDGTTVSRPAPVDVEVCP